MCAEPFRIWSGCPVNTFGPRQFLYQQQAQLPNSTPMSLINEALRKAQNQRNQAPGLGDGADMSHQPVNPVNPPSRLGLMIGLSIFIIILLGLVAGLSFLVISEYELQPAQQPVPPNPQSQMPQTTSTTETASIKAAANEVADVVPESANAMPTAPEAQPPASRKQLPEVIEGPVAKPGPIKEIADWVEQCTISGVRITSSKSKVILNNKGYSPNEVINDNLGLKILKIEPDRIRFIDSNGAEYIKSF